MVGSGYSEILIEVNLITRGRLKNVLNGKAYSKSLWCLKIVSECFERLLLSAFINQLDEDHPLRSTDMQIINDLLFCLNDKNLSAAYEDTSLKNLTDAYQEFEQKVRNQKPR